MNKKNGELYLAITATLLAAGIYGFLNKKKHISFVESNRLTIENFVNRLKEYDMSPEKEASNLKKAIFEALPPFAMFIESLNLIKDVGPLPLSFKDFRDILIKDEKVLYSLFP